MKNFLECPLCPPNEPTFAAVAAESGTKRLKKAKASTGANVSAQFDSDKDIFAQDSLVEAMNDVEAMDVGGSHRTTLQCGDWIMYRCPVSISFKHYRWVDLCVVYSLSKIPKSSLQ